MNSKLNERQEKFCQEIMQGKTQRQAYYSAYPSSEKWKPESVDVRANNLINNNKVLLRLQKLRTLAEEENRVSRNDLIEQLKSIGFVDIDLEDIKPNEKIKAIEVMAKILGYDKPENESSPISGTPEDALTTEELRKIAKQNPITKAD